LGDELLVETHRRRRRRLVVVHDELDLAAEEPALRVQVALAELVPLVLVAAELRVATGEREGRADPDRSLLPHGRQRRRGDDDADDKRNARGESHGNLPGAIAADIT